MDFQVHITVEHTKKDFKDLFLSLCKKSNVKPTLIVLPNGTYLNHTMFTSIINDNSINNVLEKISLLCENFVDNGFKILRKKVEISPNDDTFYLNDKNYYECHIKISDYDYLLLEKICKNLDAHISKNTLENKQRFITIRNNDKKTFYEHAENVKNKLLENNINIIKEKFEYCIYDSYINLDENWAYNGG